MKLLILDLDETLIHAAEDPLEREADFIFEQYHVYKRPFVDEFLAFVRQYFLVGVWTTAGSDYAKAIVKATFSSNYPLQFLWSRERCTRACNPHLMEHYFIKNLAKLKRKGYQLENILMIDDTPKKLERNYGNLIQITAWVGNQDDIELLLLQKYLLELEGEPNVRSIEKRGWQNRFVP